MCSHFCVKEAKQQNPTHLSSGQSENFKERLLWGARSFQNKNKRALAHTVAHTVVLLRTREERLELLRTRKGDAINILCTLNMDSTALHDNQQHSKSGKRSHHAAVPWRNAHAISSRLP